jgi:hypothetical protein
MPINVLLVTERDDRMRSVPDYTGIVARAANQLPESRLWHYIDLYGNTYFNQLQMDDAIADWERASQFVHTDRDQEIHTAVMRILEQCVVEQHTYVKFVGD